MNDFDFEELDKAVNNLATKTQDEHGASQSAVTPKVAPIVAAPTVAASEPKPEPKPEPVTVSTPVTSTEAPTIKSTSSPAKHRLGDTRSPRRGSFMDIVPPAPRKVPTRVGVSVQPVSKADEIVPEAPVPAKVEPEEPALPDLSELKLDLDMAPKASESPIEPKAERAEPKPTEPQTHQAPAEGDKKPEGDVAWPDPLDFGADKPAAVKADEPAEPVSPFLAEAKVEKRPLGAFSNFKPAEAPAPAESVEPRQTPEVKDELTPEVDGTFEEPKQEKAPLPPKEGEKIEDEEPSKPDVHGAAMMAIPDQYRPEPKTTDKTTRPVFDTKEYHPPLIEAAGHHDHRGGGSMWGKIFVAFVALALIAVAGYFAYIYLVQQ